MTDGSVNAQQVERFAAQARAWWDPNGSFRVLHRVNPVRLGFIRSQLLAHFARDPAGPRPFAGLRLADIGCGGGLVAEAMARLGFAVTAIDASAATIAAARAHAEAVGLSIDYRCCTPEALAAQGELFDAAVALELIEHLADQRVFYAALGSLVRPGGAFIAATLNRTVKSFVLAIIGAEYVLHWLPRGTHEWRNFVPPSALALNLRRNRLIVTRFAGISFAPQKGEWSLSADLSVNYVAMAVRR